MTEQADQGPEIHPSVLFLFDLLKWVEEGRICAPAFQRDYVWSRADILDLFDSVQRSYPIGTLLFWSDPTGSAEGTGRLGPFVLSGDSQKTLLVLDGHQRLTTLAGVLLRGVLISNSEDRDANRWNVFYDAAVGQFTHLKEGSVPEVWQIPARALSQTRLMFSATRKLFEGREKLNGKDPGELAERIEEVARALQSYKLPIVEFRTSNLNLAVESFTRLNRRGVEIGPDEMFSALTYQTGRNHSFNIAREISATIESLASLGFGDVDRLVVLRTFLMVSDLDPYRTDWKRLGEDTQKKAAATLPDAMRRAAAGLALAVAFLKGEGVAHTRLLPYGIQLLGLGVWFSENPSPSESSKHLLRRWFWLTSFAAWFGQGNPSRYARLFKELLDAARLAEKEKPFPSSFEQLPWSTAAMGFPRVFDFRSARARAWLCLFVKNGAVKPDGTRLSVEVVAAAIKDRGPASLRRIANGSSKIFSSPANRIFDVFDDATHTQARSLLRGMDVHRDFWSDHHISDTICSSNAGSLEIERLLSVRQQTMIDIEQAFLRSLDLVPYEAGTADAPIDNDGPPPIDEGGDTGM